MKGSTRLTAAAAVCLAMLMTGPAIAGARPASDSRPVASTAFCANLLAQLPKDAQVGEDITVGAGIENCGPRRAHFLMIYLFDGPCGVQDHQRLHFTLRRGEGVAFGSPFTPPCPGRYRLLVRAYHRGDLLDRKVRHMVVTGS